MFKNKFLFLKYSLMKKDIKGKKSVKEKKKPAYF